MKEVFFTAFSFFYQTNLYEMERISDYKGYNGLPPLVGLTTMSEAIEVGLTVDESVARLKRFHWSLKRLALLFSYRITAMPIYELKMVFGFHSHLCAENVTNIFDRIREMREPPFGMDSAPDPYLEMFWDEIECAPSVEALILGLYEKGIPALKRGFEQYIDDCNKLIEHPTYRICRFALIDLEDIALYGKSAISTLVSKDKERELKSWLELLDNCLNNMGDLDGTKSISKTDLNPIFSKEAYEYDRVPCRDERFKDLYNMGVNAEIFLIEPEFDSSAKLLMLYFKRMREIDVPEMMASIIHDTKDKPWKYYKDLIRQLWDESRHAMMGEVGFVSLGIDWTKIPFTFAWSLQLNTKLTPKERHAVLFYIEQGLMPAKTGKQHEWEVAVASENRLAELIQDYDWADEILHARIGRDWIVSEIGGQKETMDYGNNAWDKVYTNWEKWKEDGLTEHHNWFPSVYREACDFRNIAPDPKILAYNVSYQEKRADNNTINH